MADMLADGNVKVTWVPGSLANIHLPTVAELTSGSAVDLECLITKDGLDIKPDTAAVDNTALCSTDETEEPGLASYSIEITAKRKDTTVEDKAWNTLTDKAAGTLVVRRGPAVSVAYAAGQAVETYPARCGRPGMLAPEKNSVQKFQVKLFNNAAADPRAQVAA